MDENDILVKGEYITIYYPNYTVYNVVLMVLEYFDNELYKDVIIIINGVPEHDRILKYRSLYKTKKLIIYNLEQLIGHNTLSDVNSIVKHASKADEIWDYDALNIEYLKLYYNITNVRYVPMLYTKCLERDFEKPDKYLYDLLFYGSFYLHRFNMYWYIRNLFPQLKLGMLSGNFNDDLDFHIKHAKIILNLSTFKPYNRLEQVRIFYNLINGKCVLSEESQHNYFGNLIEEFNESNFKDKLDYLLENDNFIDKGNYAKERFKTHHIKNNIEI